MMLVDRAAEKPSMLKLISVAVQRARPPITGNRARFTHSPAGRQYTQYKKSASQLSQHLQRSVNRPARQCTMYLCTLRGSAWTWWRWRWALSSSPFLQKTPPRSSGSPSPAPLLWTWQMEANISLILHFWLNKASTLSYVLFTSKPPVPFWWFTNKYKGCLGSKTFSSRAEQGNTSVLYCYHYIWLYFVLKFGYC